MQSKPRIGGCWCSVGVEKLREWEDSLARAHVDEAGLF